MPKPYIPHSVRIAAMISNSKYDFCNQLEGGDTTCVFDNVLFASSNKVLASKRERVRFSSLAPAASKALAASSASASRILDHKSKISMMRHKNKNLVPTKLNKNKFESLEYLCTTLLYSGLKPSLCMCLSQQEWMHTRNKMIRDINICKQPKITLLLSFQIFSSVLQ